MLIENQTAKADAGKPRLTLVPRRIIWASARREAECRLGFMTRPATIKEACGL